MPSARWASGARSPDAPTEPCAGITRVDAGVEQLAQALAAQRRARRSGRARALRAQQHHAAHRVARQRRADAGRVRAHEVLLQLRDLVGRDPHLGERAEAGVDAVDRGRGVAAGDDRVDHLARARPSRRVRACADLDAAAAARDVGQHFEGQRCRRRAETGHAAGVSRPTRSEGAQNSQIPRNDGAPTLTPSARSDDLRSTWERHPKMTAGAEGGRAAPPTAIPPSAERACERRWRLASTRCWMSDDDVEPSRPRATAGERDRSTRRSRGSRARHRCERPRRARCRRSAAVRRRRRRRRRSRRAVADRHAAAHAAAGRRAAIPPPVPRSTTPMPLARRRSPAPAVVDPAARCRSRGCRAARPRVASRPCFATCRRAATTPLAICRWRRPPRRRSRGSARCRRRPADGTARHRRRRVRRAPRLPSAAAARTTEPPPLTDSVERDDAARRPDIATLSAGGVEVGTGDAEHRRRSAARGAPRVADGASTARSTSSATPAARSAPRRWSRELDATGRQRRPPRMLAYELGELYERRLADEARAVKAYGRALTLDPVAARRTCGRSAACSTAAALWPNLVEADRRRGRVRARRLRARRSAAREGARRRRIT